MCEIAQSKEKHSSNHMVQIDMHLSSWKYFELQFAFPSLQNRVFILHFIFAPEMNPGHSTITF